MCGGQEPGVVTAVSHVPAEYLQEQRSRKGRWGPNTSGSSSRARAGAAGAAVGRWA